MAGLRFGRGSKRHLQDGLRTGHLVLTEQLVVLDTGNERERVKVAVV